MRIHFSPAQERCFDEVLFAGEEFFERAVAETTIFNEFVAKLAQAHSVRDFGSMYRECTKHQLEFILRDMERVLKHGERAVDNTARLVETRRQNGASLPDDQERVRSSSPLELQVGAAKEGVQAA